MDRSSSASAFPRRSLARLIPATLAALLAPAIGHCQEEPAEGDADIATAAVAVLKEQCYQCHGIERKGSNVLNMLDRTTLVADRGADREPYVVPGDPEGSLLWNSYVEPGYMPPESTGRSLTDEQKESIRLWIEQGAPWPADEEPDRPFIEEVDILQAILDDITRQRREDRRFIRYFSLAHIHNNPAATAADLRLQRAAFSKAANSLSDQPVIVIPEAIDDHDTIFRVDLRDYGWQSLSVWGEVLEAYPYGLKPRQRITLASRRTGQTANDLFEEIRERFGEVRFDGIAYLRADWFTVTATRPPLYNTLAKIPEEKQELLDRLGVEVERNLRQGRAKRAGIVQSGVSGQNRLLEYHPSNFGPYWESYDFFPKRARSNLMRFPLGPKSVVQEELEDFAFEHAGGEIIFNLANRLQGYMLTDENGARIDVGPIEIVRDSKETAGTPAIVNGLSCMACHREGMIDFRDDVRAGLALSSPDALDAVDALYPDAAEMDDVVQESRRIYLRQLEKAIGPFLRVGADADRNITSFPEPVSTVAGRYQKDLDLATAAAELGYDDPNKLGAAIQRNDDLRELALGPLAQGRRIKRDIWEAREGGLSLMQEAASELGIGIPTQAK